MGQVLRSYYLVVNDSTNNDQYGPKATDSALLSGRREEPSGDSPALPQGLFGQHDRTVIPGPGDAKYVEKIVIVTGLVYLCLYLFKWSLFPVQYGGNPQYYLQQYGTSTSLFTEYPFFPRTTFTFYFRFD